MPTAMDEPAVKIKRTRRTKDENAPAPNCKFQCRLNAAELPVAAATARVSATQAFQHCAKNCIQVHGGMGFTWEFDCHLYYRRSNQLALVLGGSTEWEDLLIQRMQANRAA